MDNKELFEYIDYAIKGGILNYGGLVFKAKRVNLRDNEDCCDICPLSEKCTAPLNIFCACLEATTSPYWVLEEVSQG